MVSSRRGSVCTATAVSPLTTAASRSAKPWSPVPCCAWPDGFDRAARGLPVCCEESGRRDDGGGGRIGRGNEVAAGQIEHPVATGVGVETRVIPVGEAGRDLVDRLPREVHLRHDGCRWGLRTGAADDVREQVAGGFEHGLAVVETTASLDGDAAAAFGDEVVIRPRLQ